MSALFQNNNYMLLELLMSCSGLLLMSKLWTQGHLLMSNLRAAWVINERR
jgi:hypothetical protein